MPLTSTPSTLLLDPSREVLLHVLYEAAELEHNLMCTYLYAAFSIRSGVKEGLTPAEAEATSRWRREIIEVAIDEMSHLAAVWNLTSALGGTPRFGRTNFPLDPGYLPAGIVVKLAPLNEAVLQHFIHLERPADSPEPDGEGFAYERGFVRGTTGRRLTPMGLDYATVGEFYAALGQGLQDLVARVGEEAAFCGDPVLQLSRAIVDLPGAAPVRCLTSALAALDAIVVQGEGAPESAEGSHFDRFCKLRAEYRALKAVRADFAPGHPAATNPVLRRPPRPEGRVWIESPEAIETVDLANAGYGLMLRLLAYSYSVPATHPDKAPCVDLAIGLMQAVTFLGERAARLPAGHSSPGCQAGMSFTTLRDAAPLPPGLAARRFFLERFDELAVAAAALPISQDSRAERSARALSGLARRASQCFGPVAPVLIPAHDASAAAPIAVLAANTAAAGDAAGANAVTVAVGAGVAEGADAAKGADAAEGRALMLRFDTRRCIHARFCVTQAPTVFLANVAGPWLHPDTLDAERLVAVAQECPSGAITYRRKDGGLEEAAPPVNLAALREAGPYAFRGDLRIDGAAVGYRATLCRCGASGNKPFCDGSHKGAGFAASGEPATTAPDSLAARAGALHIDPQPDGPLQVRGNLEITSGTGRVVARVMTARLCRCGASESKPFCDGSHARVGFRS